jgi:hypothetical protein
MGCYGCYGGCKAKPDDRKFDLLSPGPRSNREKESLMCSSKSRWDNHEANPISALDLNEPSALPSDRSCAAGGPVAPQLQRPPRPLPSTPINTPRCSFRLKATDLLSPAQLSPINSTSSDGLPRCCSGPQPAVASRARFLSPAQTVHVLNEHRSQAHRTVAERPLARGAASAAKVPVPDYTRLRQAPGPETSRATSWTCIANTSYRAHVAEYNARTVSMLSLLRLCLTQFSSVQGRDFIICDFRVLTRAPPSRDASWSSPISF